MSYGPTTACKVWSMTADMQFTGLCVMTLRPESANDTAVCVLCVTPVDPAEEI
jgi:hypothetical protein